MRSEAQCQLATGGVSHHRQPFQIKLEPGVLLTYISQRRPNVGKRTRPASTIVADAAVLDIENRRTRPSQCVAQVSGMCEVIFRAPEATVDVQKNRVRSLARR